MSGQKIISLLPAATEIVCALGLQDNLIGRSHECDFPLEITNLPVCSEARFIPGSDSTSIDRQVSDILSDALSIYVVNKELISKLEPDFVITQNQCEVCAVSERDVEEALTGLLHKDVEIISLSPNALADIQSDIRRIGRQLGVAGKAEALLEELNDRVDIVRHKLKYIDQKPTLACIEWLSPLMVAGNWTPELISIAGGISVLAESGKHSPFVDFESIQAENPDILVIIPCGFSISRTLQEINFLLNLPGWKNLNAVKNNKVYIADGNQYFNRSGPRIVDSIEILAEIINPKMFSFGYENEGWIRFNVSEPSIYF